MRTSSEEADFSAHRVLGALVGFAALPTAHLHHLLFLRRPHLLAGGPHQECFLPGPEQREGELQIPLATKQGALLLCASVSSAKMAVSKIISGLFWFGFF